MSIKRKKLYVGIDPGITGGMVCVTTDTLECLEDIEWLSIQCRETDFRKLSATVERIYELKERVVAVCIERISPAPPGIGRSSGAKLYGSFFHMLALVSSFSNASIYVKTPGQWQKEVLGRFRSLKSKERSVLWANSVYPNLGLEKKDDGKADSLALSRYARILKNKY